MSEISNILRALAEAYPDPEFVQQLVAQLPWGHNVRLLAVKDAAERECYLRQAVEHGWSCNVLIHQVESGLYARQGKALTNFSRTPPQSDLAQQLLKDPYNFDFLTLGPGIDECELERGLIEHVCNFILELGKGFAFLGSQYHLEVGSQDYLLDFLFYHVRLRCYVVIDLKIEEFKPKFAGKMNFYWAAVDNQLRYPDDQPTIGLILCKDGNEVIVEYALRDMNKPMGVAQYRLTHGSELPKHLQAALPTPAELSKELPLFSLVKMRMDLEKALVDLAAANGIATDRVGIRPLVDTLKMAGLIPPAVAAALMPSVNVMNKAAVNRALLAK